MCPSKRPCVLVADDDPVVRTILNKTLSDDYEVITLSSGENMKSILDAYNPTLAILDVRMPGISGLGVCRSIRNLPGHETMPVIILSSLFGAQDVLKGIHSGANFYLTKPFHSNNLHALVDTCIERKQGASDSTTP